eukprot:302935_1
MKTDGSGTKYVIAVNSKQICCVLMIFVVFTVINFILWSSGRGSVSALNTSNVSESWAVSHCVGLDYLDISNLISGWYHMIELISTEDYDHGKFESFVETHFDDNMSYIVDDNIAWNDKATFINKTEGIRQYFGKEFWNFIIISGNPYIFVNLTANYATANVSSLFSFSPGHKNDKTKKYEPIYPHKPDGLVSSNWYFVKMNEGWFIKEYNHTFNDSSQKCMADMALAQECSLQKFKPI